MLRAQQCGDLILLPELCRKALSSSDQFAPRLESLVPVTLDELCFKVAGQLRVTARTGPAG